MTAGVPGSGIGGFFYVVSALLMPVHESISLARGTSSRASRRVVIRQVLNACGVLCGVWFTGWFIVRSSQTISSSLHIQNHAIAPAFTRLSVSSAVITLLAVFLAVELAGALKNVSGGRKRAVKRGNKGERKNMRRPVLYVLKK